MMGAQIKKHVSKHASICALSNAALGYISFLRNQRRNGMTDRPVWD